MPASRHSENGEVFGIIFLWNRLESVACNHAVPNNTTLSNDRIISGRQTPDSWPDQLPQILFCPARR